MFPRLIDLAVDSEQAVAVPVLSDNGSGINPGLVVSIRHNVTDA